MNSKNEIIAGGVFEIIRYTDSFSQKYLLVAIVWKF